MTEPALPAAAAATAHPEATPLQKASWVLLDWANSGYGLIVIGPVFSPYFMKTLLPVLPGTNDHGLKFGDTVLQPSAVIGWLTSLSMLLMALGAPMLGAIADIKGWTRRLLTLFGVAGAVLAIAMVTLGPGKWVWGSVLFVGSNFCFGTAFAFTSAFLPRLTRPAKQGSLSGWGFAAGYVGGALALIIVLFMIRQAGDDPEGVERNVRYGLGLSGLWWLLFSLPAYLLLDEIPAQATEADRGPLVLAGFRRIKETFKRLRLYRNLFLFLLAFLLYNDGVDTVINMSPAFGTDQLGMTQEQLIKMFLIVQFVAFGGALAFGYLADRIGNKTVIVINLFVWVLAVALAFFVKTPGQFTAVGVMVGAVLGGVQASSRALMALLSPEHIRNEAFGFFSISGKFASVFGPALFGLAVTWFGEAKYGILSVLPFLVSGLIVLWFVSEPRSNQTQPTSTA